MSSTPDQPSIAVVIPVYNGEAYLSEAIDSALAQTHRPSEIVILDDASSDGSDSIIDRYRAHPLIKADRLATRVSAPAAWNRAIRLSKAEYFVVLAHDDRLHPRFLAETANVLRSGPDTALVVTGYDLIDALGNCVAARPIREPYLLGRTTFDVFFRELVVTRGMYFKPTCTVVARDAFESIQGFDERIHAVYDYDFYIRLAGTFPMHGLSESLVDYRTHPANMSTAIFHEDKGDSDVIFRKLATYAMLNERQRQQLAQNVSLFQFNYLTRAIRSERFTLTNVHAVRKEVEDRLSGWARADSPYSPYIRTHPDRLRRRLAWQVSAYSLGVSLIRMALRFSARRRRLAKGARDPQLAFHSAISPGAAGFEVETHDAKSRELA
jgi:glycosyltransferase involved in cell wall biosynthesis